MPTESRSTTLVAQLRSPFTRNMSWLAASLLAISLYSLGSTPLAVDIVREPWDKLLHFVTFGVLASLISLGLGGRRPWLTIMLTGTLASLDEILQIFEPGRHPGFDDLSADFAAAIVIAFLCARLLAPRKDPAGD